MGFAASLAAEALRRKQGNVQDAVQLLLDHPEGALPPDDAAPPPPPPPPPPAASASASAATELPVCFGAGAGGAPVAVAQPFGVPPTYTFAASPAYVPLASASYGAPPAQQSAYPASPAYPAYTPAVAAGYAGAASPYGTAPPASAAAPLAHHPQGMPTFAVPFSGYRLPPAAGLQPAGPPPVGAGLGVGVVSYHPTQPAEWAAYARAPVGAPLGAGPAAHGATPIATPPWPPGQQPAPPQRQPGQQGQPPSYTPPTSGYRV